MRSLSMEKMFLVFKMKKLISNLSVSLPWQFPQPIREKYANQPAVISQTPQPQDNTTGLRRADLNPI